MEDTLLTNAGHRLPRIGYGCLLMESGSIDETIRCAAEAGYRLFDTAKRYGNEREVGRAIRHCGVAREAIWLTDKLWPTDYDEPEAAIEGSLSALGCDRIDIMLLHWPGSQDARRFRAWEAMLAYRDRGRIGVVGVSNFSIKHLESIRAQFGDYPELNQIERHPWYQQRELQEFCEDRGIVIEAWRPLLKGRIFDEPCVGMLAEKYGKTPPQIILRWHVQHNGIPIPKSQNEKRIRENISIFDFALSQEDMRLLDALECGRSTAHFDADTFDGIVEGGPVP